MGIITTYQEYAKHGGQQIGYTAPTSPFRQITVLH